KRAEEALATSEAELRALFASMQDVVLVIDQEGVYREIAPTDPGLLYKPAQELLGQNLRDVFSAEQVETFISVIRQTLDTGQTTRIEYELTISEHPIWFSTSISPMGADSTLWVAHDITEQKQAVNEIRRRAEEFAALYDTSVNLSAEHDLNTLLQTIVENAATMLHAYAGGMYLYDPVREELEVTFTTDPSMPVGTRLRLGEGVAGRVAKTRQSMRIDNYSTWDGRSKKYEGTAVRATIEVPMLYKGELIGVLVAHEAGASKRQYTKADEHLLSLFAFQAAAAIQNARLLEQERTRAKELSTLYEATKTISSDLDLESVLETVAEKMANISHSDGCTLSLLNHEQDTVTTLVDHRSKHPEHAESKDVIYYLKEYPASRHVLETGQPLTINIKDKEADQSELEHMTKRGITTVLMLPLIAHNQVIGLVEIYEEERERTYKQEEIDLLQHLAAQAAISIENARLFEDAQRRLRQTMALREIDQAITGSVDFQRVLKVVLKHTINELGVDAAVILLYDPEEQSLHYEIGSGFLAESLQHTHLQLGQGYAGRAALGKQTIYIPNLQVRNTDFLRSPTFHQEGFICYFGVPLIAKGEIKGVLEIFHRTPLNPDIEWLSFMETLAGQVAIAIDNATLYKNLQHSNEELSLAYDATIEGWSRALDLRDRETEGHTLRVTKLTVEMAAEMGLSKEELVHIRRGALLHDIGKMGVPDRILLKPDTLTDEEWKIMQKHPIFAYEMLSPISFLRPALDIPYCHHERWDGTGYPRKLKGDEIPLVARIFAVVDGRLQAVPIERIGELTEGEASKVLVRAEGLGPGARVMVTHLPNAVDGLKVQELGEAQGLSQTDSEAAVDMGT
ncbi:MAG: GAF domain-containing protein, partial [Anaerolineales bacterium]